MKRRHTNFASVRHKPANPLFFRKCVIVVVEDAREMVIMLVWFFPVILTRERGHFYSPTTFTKVLHCLKVFEKSRDLLNNTNRTESKSRPLFSESKYTLATS